MGRALLLALVLGSLGVFPSAFARQAPLSNPDYRGENDDWLFAPNQIKRVAVIGAGPSGLMHAATLIEQGFEVRLFERAPKPGGQWFYTDKTPVAAPFPNRPIEVAGYVPDVPSHLPQTRIFVDGDEGKTNDWRLREHWNPSSIWQGLHSTVPPWLMTMPNIVYPDDTPWVMPFRFMQRHVRQFASSVGLNSNDEEHANVTSYSTRVERIEKRHGAQRWTVSLRKLTPLSSEKLQVDWWSEGFDAVVVGTFSEADSPWVPSIPGLKEWAEAYPDRVYHGRNYRTPYHLAGKNVLIVGAAVSGYGIANDIIPYASSVSVSSRHSADTEPYRTFLAMFHKNVTFVPEVTEFSAVQGRASTDVKNASLRLANGTSLTGFDEIILTTGYRRSFPFLAGLHNSSIKGYEEPETEVAPVITDGTHHRSLHWTGHYIPDPTLGFASYEPWELGPFQALSFAKVWAGKARLPSTAAMWRAYPGAGKEFSCRPADNELCNREFVSFLNEASLEFGGRLVAPLSVKNRQGIDYFLSREQKREINLTERNRQTENLPRSRWPARNGSYDDVLAGGARFMEPIPREEVHWAEFNGKW